MTSPSDEDPFLQVQQDVESQLQTTRGLFSSYMRIRNLSTSSNSPELQSARADLDMALEDLREDVSDLSDSVRAAERNPAQFGLDGVEVSRRRKLVADAAAEVDDMTNDVSREDPDATTTTTTRSTVGAQSDPFPRRRGSVSRPVVPLGGGDPLMPDPSAFSMDAAMLGGEGGDTGRRNGAGDADYAAEFEHETQVQMMRDQDEQLDDVYVTVGNLRNMADDMGRELHQQTEMLGETDRLTERVGERLQTGMAKMKYVIRKNEDGLSSCCIAVLVVVLIILLVLLLIL